jgi:CRISPR-associated protein Csm5
MKFQQYKVTLEVITPVHIGYGDAGRIRKNGYVIRNGKAIIKQSLWSSREDYEIDAQNAITKQPRDFCLFIKNPYGEPYIPGSSLKGAIRTCLMWGDTKAVNKDGKLIVPELPVNDNYNGISISDSEPLSTDDLLLCQKIDVSVSDKENEIPLLRECLKQSVCAEFTMTLDNRWNITDIDEKIKNFNAIYSAYLNKFRLPDYIKDDSARDCAIIYMGGGVGFEAKVISKNTSDNMKRISYGKHLAKCTVLDNELCQMGACEIRFEEK